MIFPGSVGPDGLSHSYATLPFETSHRQSSDAWAWLRSNKTLFVGCSWIWPLGHGLLAPVSENSWTSHSVEQQLTPAATVSRSPGPSPTKHEVRKRRRGPEEPASGLCLLRTADRSRNGAVFSVICSNEAPHLLENTKYIFPPPPPECCPRQ